MIKINNKKIDVLFQVEKDVPLNKLLNGLTLNDNIILVICPSLFFANVISDLYDFMSDEDIHNVESAINLSWSNVEFKVKYKNKEFDFMFLITPTEQKVVNIPLDGQKVFNVGFKKTEFL